MDHDWRDIENTVWVQDIPRRPSPIPHQPKSDDFPSTLESVLYSINVAPAIASLISTGVRRTRACSHPPVRLIWCSQAPQHPAQYYSSRCTSHALGLLPRTHNAHPQCCRETRGLACRRQVRTYGPHARRQSVKPAAAGCLARIPGASRSEERTGANPHTGLK
jgi:hypothetical protein